MALVSKMQRIGQHSHDFGGSARLKRPLIQYRRERRTCDQRRNDEGPAFLLKYSIHGHDIGMAQLGSTARLAQQAIAFFPAAQHTAMRYLDGNHSVEFKIDGPINGAKPTCSETIKN